MKRNSVFAAMIIVMCMVIPFVSTHALSQTLSGIQGAAAGTALTVSLNCSTADLALYGPDERECSRDISEISNSRFDIGENGQQTAALSEPKPGEYRYVIRGKTNGSCRLTATSFKDGAPISSETLEVQLKKHRITRGFVTAAVSGDVLHFALGAAGTVKKPDGSDLTGDINGDGEVNIVDIMKIAVKWNKKSGDPAYDEFFDKNEDGAIDVQDIMQVASDWFAPEEKPVPSDDNRQSKLKVSVRTASGDPDISEIRLDVQKMTVCTQEDDCQTVDIKKQMNLTDSENTAAILNEAAISEGVIHRITLELGSDNFVVSNGKTYPLSVPGNEDSGLKLILNGRVKSGELKHILIDMDPKTTVKFNNGQGYSLKPVIKLSASANAPVASDSAVIDPEKGGSLKKQGKFELQVPPGAVVSPMILWENETEQEGRVTPLFTLGPEGTSFDKPVKVKLNYDPTKIPEGFSENNLVILHDGEAIVTVVNAEAKTLEGEIAHFSSVQGSVLEKSAVTSVSSENTTHNSSSSQGPWPFLRYNGMVQDVPADVQPGQRVTVIWGLKNDSGIDAMGYSLIPVNGTGGASFPSFSIPAGRTGSARVDNLLIPSVPVPYMSFKIIDASGNVLPTLGIDLYIGSGGIGPGPCTVPPCPPLPCIAPEPTVDGAVQWNNGQGSAYTEVKVSNTVGDPGFELNGESQDVTPNGSSYVTQGNPKDGQENEHRITVQGECNLSAYMEYEYYTNRSDIFGFKNALSDCGGTCGMNADPVNTAIGNFAHRETDYMVAGLGDTDIHLERTYNSQAVLWTPASLRNYLPDGSYEVITEPPQYFGKGWSSVFGEFLLEVDYGPLYKGVQILYSDGHTANFKKQGDEYIADSPGNHDLVVKEGDEYVLYRNGCKCSQDSKRFNSEGKLIAISDKNGNEIRLIYAGSMLAAVENASGRRIEFEMNGEGRITKAKLPEGITLSYEYENDMLTAFVNGRGMRTVYKYDDEGQMTEIVSPKGHPIVRNTYDSEYRVSEQIVGENEKYRFKYQEGLTFVRDAYGHATVHHYDEQLRLVQIDHPDGNSEYYEYDENNNRTEYRDQSGAEWKWTYDENGNRLSADGPLGWHREWQYNDKNQVVRMTEKVDAATMRTTNFEYDSNGNLIRFCNPLGGCGSVTYDALGQPVELKDFAGNATIHAYDAEGDLISVTDAVQAVTRFSHDGLGRTVSMTRPQGSAFSYIYDKNSNLTDVNGPMEWHISFAFDENDRLTQKTDPNKGSITYEYNASDRPVKVKNQLSFDTAAYTYGLMNEITGLADAEGRLWSYAYDEMLRVVQVSGPLDTHFYYAYNPVGKITDMTDANGIVMHTNYDALYRPLSLVRNYRAGFAPNADTNVTVSFAYNLLGNVLQTTDPEGYVTQFVYDLMGQRTKKSDAEGYEWVYEYDPMGNLSKVLNPRGFDSLYAYTPVYQLEKAVNPEGHALSYTYDPDGKLTDKRDAMNVITHFAYDDLGRLVQKIRNYMPGHAEDSQTNVTTAYTYDLAGNLRFLTNPLKHQAEFVYDAAHRRTDFSDFEKGLFRFAYDRVNNLLSVTDAENNPTLYVYDDLNRMISRTNAENETERYAYDKMGNRTHLIEADGTDTLYGYDFIYRLNSVTQNFREGVNPGNDVNALTRYAYDARGLLTQIVNANNAATSFAFDKVGNMIQETDPIGNVWDYEYDGMGNRTVRTDAKRDRTEYAYYPDDMLEEIRYANGQAVQYVYDANNNRTEMKDWLGNTAWEYDPLNRITAQNDPFARAMAYAYDAASNRRAVTYPDGNMVNYTYSPNNWMASATDPTGGVISYTRDKMGNILHIANPNLTKTDITYDRVYRTLTLENLQDKGQGLNSTFAYTYNVLGHVKNVVKNYGNGKPDTLSETYTYDGLHRLSGAVIDPLKKDAVRMTYTYDAVGNRLAWISNDDLSTAIPYDGFVRTYAYNAANQLLTVDSNMEMDNADNVTSYAYDPNGNRINRLKMKDRSIDLNTDYSFDPENRLISVLSSKYNGQDTVQTEFTEPGVTEPDAGLEDWTEPLPRGQDNKENGKKPSDETATEGSGIDSPVATGENQIFGALTTLQYDGGGRRMVKVYDPKVDPKTLASQGNAGKKEMQYVFDGLDPLAEYDVHEPHAYDNYYRGAMGRITTMQQFNKGSKGGMYWYHYNFKGDVAGLTKHNGNSTHNYRYDPYGAVYPDTGNFTETQASSEPHNHYLLTGKEADQHTGLTWFGARHYDPEVGGWVAQDSYRGTFIEPSSLHRYLYSLDNPVTFYDVYGFYTKQTSETQYMNSCIASFDDIENSWLDIKYLDLGLQSADYSLQLFRDTAGILSYRNYAIKGISMNSGGNMRGMVLDADMFDTYQKLENASENLGYVLWAYEVGKSGFSAYEKVQNGEGSLEGQIINTGASIVTKSPVNILGVAGGIVDFVGNPIAEALGSEVKVDVTGTMDRMIESAIDPVVRENRIDNAVEKWEKDGTLDCVIDRKTCGMNWFEHKVWMLADIFVSE